MMLVRMVVVLSSLVVVSGLWNSYMESVIMLIIFRCEVVKVGLIGVCLSRFI